MTLLMGYTSSANSAAGDKNRSGMSRSEYGPFSEIPENFVE